MLEEFGYEVIYLTTQHSYFDKINKQKFIYSYVKYQSDINAFEKINSAKIVQSAFYTNESVAQNVSFKTNRRNLNKICELCVRLVRELKIRSVC